MTANRFGEKPEALRRWIDDWGPLRERWQTLAIEHSEVWLVREVWLGHYSETSESMFSLDTGYSWSGGDQTLWEACGVVTQRSRPLADTMPIRSGDPHHVVSPSMMLCHKSLSRVHLSGQPGADVTREENLAGSIEARLCAAARQTAHLLATRPLPAEYDYAEILEPSRSKTAVDENRRRDRRRLLAAETDDERGWFELLFEAGRYPGGWADHIGVHSGFPMGLVAGLVPASSQIEHVGRPVAEASVVAIDALMMMIEKVIPSIEHPLPVGSVRAHQSGLFPKGRNGLGEELAGAIEALHCRRDGERTDIDILREYCEETDGLTSDDAPKLQARIRKARSDGKTTLSAAKAHQRGARAPSV